MLTRFTQATQYHAKTTIPSEWAKALSHIAADTGKTKHALLQDAVALLLRYHGHEAPEPAVERTVEK